MHKSVELSGKEVKYDLRLSRRARRARLTVCNDRGLVVVIPRNYSETFVEKFIRAKSRWILGKLEYFKKFKDKPYLLCGTRQDYLKHKDAALEMVKDRLVHFNQFYNFKIGRISVKNQRTRWGSCSHKGNLNFNYKIVLAPEAIADYIVVHELCHLAEFNHSKKFWALVSQAVPDHKEIIKQIRLK